MFGGKMHERGPATFGLGGIAGMPEMAGVLGSPDSTAPAQDPLEKLEKLAKLHESGVLTDEEFAAAKEKILNEEI